MGKDPRREAQIRSGPGALDSKHPTSYRHGSPLAQIPFPLELGQEGREDNRGRRRGAGWGGHRGGEVGFRLLDHSHSDWREMVPHSGFDLHFSYPEQKQNFSKLEFFRGL